MVATLLSLRWRILVHQFRRDWWRLLFVVAGAIWSISIVPLLIVGSQRLSLETAAVKADALVAVAGILGAAWIVVPLLATGVDDTLEPSRFAPWGVEVKRIMPGLAVAAFTTVPAVFFVAVALVMGTVWRGETAGAHVLIVGMVGAVLTAMSWVFSARLAALWGARLLAARVGRMLIGALVVVLIGALVGGAALVRADGLESAFAYEIPALLDGLGWTPVGAGMAAAGAFIYHDAVGPWWRLTISASWVVVLYVAWRSAVQHALVNPVTRGGGSRRHDDAMLDTASSPNFLGRPRNPRSRVVAVVRARTARSWRTDPRYLAQLIGALLFPVIGGGMAVVVAGGAGAWITVLPIALALGVGWGRHNDLAYDSSAIWLDLVSGIPGRRMIAGRLLATAQWAAPAVIAATLATAAVANRWDAAVPVGATALGVLAAALGVASVTSVALPYRVPAPGESPFGADAGSIGASLVGQVVSSLGTGLLIPVVAAPLAAAFWWGGAWWTVSVVVSLVLGPAAAIAGAMAAGSLYDQRAGRLIGAVS